jgi:3-oxoadipate enol-lactonase
MPTICRPGKPDLHYEIDDFTDSWKSAPVLILQHGYGRSSEFWYQWVPYLSRYFKVVRPDLRALGKSVMAPAAAHDITLDDYLDDLRAIIGHLGDAPVHYCGESLGGLIGMAFSGTYPNLIRSLSLVSAPVFIGANARQGYACGHGSWPEAVRKMGTAAWLKETNGSTRFPAVEILAAMASFALASDVTPFLRHITAPVLSLYPTGGVIANDEQKTLMKTHIRDIRFVSLPTPFHMIHYIKPALCARQVLAFAKLIDGEATDD